MYWNLLTALAELAAFAGSPVASAQLAAFGGSLVPLATRSQLLNPSLVDLFFLASQLVTVALGLAISYIAYRGYRRNDSRPMLFVSVGFFFALGVPAIAAGLWVALPFVGQLAVGAVTQVFEMLGMALILYGLRLNPE